ncbi:MAG TPA: DUF3857 domain-containing protein [Candidatus Omnitrophica bacterium]|nr:DUF3857 domain-containing protein [Candidatus Omnitrophota bacterium]
MKKILVIVFILIVVFLSIKIIPADYYVGLGNRVYDLAIEKYKNQDTDISRMKLGKLYFDYGKYDLSYDTLKDLDSRDAQIIAAYSLFKLSKFTEALSIFNKLGELPDPEYLYSYGLTCEEHNLYEKAEKLYAKIETGEFKNKASKRLQSISHLVHEQVGADILNMLTNSPSAEDYPDAGALVLSVKEEVEILDDNTSVSTVYAIVKILNDRGKEGFSEILLGYDSTYEKVELEFARTIKPDGTAIQVGDKNIRDVSRYLNFPLYSNARIKIISMPEVAAGNFIEYKARIYSSKLVADKHFSVRYFLQESNPVLYSSFKLITPPERKVNKRILNSQFNFFGFDLTPEVIKEKEKTVYFLELENIPQIIPEPDMPPKAEIDTILLMSSFTSWDEIFDWWSPLYKDKILLDDDIEQKVDELTQGLDSEMDRARAISSFCAQDIRYVAVEYGQAGYEPHKAPDVFLNKYGDCKDQAILLITMLRYAGFEAYPVLIGTKGTIALSEDFPVLLFNHAIAVLKINDEFIFIDPTAETITLGGLPVSDQGRDVLVFFDDEYRIMRIPDFTAQDNTIEFSTYIEIDVDESIKAQRQIASSGLFEHSRRYWLLYSLPSVIEEGIKSKVQMFSSNGRLIDYKIENVRDLDKKIIFNYSFEGDDFLIKAGKGRVLPSLVGGIDISSVLKEERIYPLDFGALTEEVDIVKVDIPEKFQFKYIPDSINIDNEWMEYSLDYILEGNTLECRNRQVAKKIYISVSEYPDYKLFIEDLASRLNQAIILETSVAK